MISIRQAEASDIRQIQSVASDAWVATYKEVYSLEKKGFVPTEEMRDTLAGHETVLVKYELQLLP